MFSRRVLEPVTLAGRTVQAGTMCLVSPALLHRDPRYWAEHEQFRPERWLQRVPGEDDRFDAKSPGQPRGAYLPFGAGPRMCIGEQFAWSEAATMLAELGRTWRLHVHHTPLTAGRSSMTLRPNGAVQARISQRTP
jgi:cytochrome P450